MAKEKKQRAKKYDEKLKINADFEDVIGVSVTEKPKPNKENIVKLLLTGDYDLAITLIEAFTDEEQEEFAKELTGYNHNIYRAASHIRGRLNNKKTINMGSMKEEWMNRQEADRDKKLAERLGITYEELGLTNWEIEPDESDDGLVYDYRVQFDIENSPKEILKKIDGIDDNGSVSLGPNGLD